MHAVCEKSRQIIVKSVTATKKKILSLAVCYFSLPSSCLLVFLVHLFHILNSTFISCSYSQHPFPPLSPCLCTDMLHLSMKPLPPLCAQMKPLSLTTQCLGNFILTTALTNYKANGTLIQNDFKMTVLLPSHHLISDTLPLWVGVCSCHETNYS